jgi:hypothetical protein
LSANPEDRSLTRKLKASLTVVGLSCLILMSAFLLMNELLPIEAAANSESDRIAHSVPYENSIDSK